MLVETKTLGISHSESFYFFDLVLGKIPPKRQPNSGYFHFESTDVIFAVDRSCVPMQDRF